MSGLCCSCKRSVTRCRPKSEPSSPSGNGWKHSHGRCAQVDLMACPKRVARIRNKALCKKDCVSKRCNASRIGVLDTPNLSANSASTNLSPGLYAPSSIASIISSYGSLISFFCLLTAIHLHTNNLRILTCIRYIVTHVAQRFTYLLSGCKLKPCKANYLI